MPTISREHSERPTAAYRCDFTLRKEVEVAAKLLAARQISTSTCLDLGFTNPGASLRLRKLGGYWTSSSWTAAECLFAHEVLNEEVWQVGIGGELPFDDKQFDVVVLARGRLCGDIETDMPLIHECHRVLKTPGLLIIGCDYKRRFSPLRLFGHQTQRGYNETGLFHLLKTGFDFLGMKTYDRMWSQVAHRITKSTNCAFVKALLHRAACVLDGLFFFTRGYHAVAYGQRKSWQNRQTMGRPHGRDIREAMLN